MAAVFHCIPDTMKNCGRNGSTGLTPSQWKSLERADEW